MSGGTETSTSVASANPATSRAGEGDFIVSGGGNKLVQTLVIGGVVVAVLWLVAKIFTRGK